MKKYFIMSPLFLWLWFSGCSNPNLGRTKNFKENHEKVVTVSDKIFDIYAPVLFDFAALEILDSVLIINELSPIGPKAIHLFDVNNLKYIGSTGFVGKGPGEITRIGRPALDKRNTTLWVNDHGKQVRWKFPLDSILNNTDFTPTIKHNLNKDLFLVHYEFINDSIAIGRAAHPTSFHSMDITTARLNLPRDQIKKFGYVHPDLKGRESYSYFSFSGENNFYVTTFTYVDLLTICNIDGSLRCNVYGPKWSNKEKKGDKFFTYSDTYKHYILTSYIGGRYVFNKEDGGKRIASPTKLLVFDTNGNYIQTIETGHEFSSFCIDKDNKRVIAYFEDRDNPLGYFNLDLD